MKLMRAFLFSALLFATAARAELFAPSSVSSEATVERVSRSSKGSVLLTTRQVKVKLNNMAPRSQSTVGIKCWMFYRDLRTNQVSVQHQDRSVWTLAPGEARDVVADKALFEYVPDHYQHFGHGRIGMSRRIPGSGHKYMGFVVRVYENGKVTNEISTASNLPALADQSSSSESGGGHFPARPSKG